MIILGIDPGTATTGFGVISAGQALKCLNYGIIQTSPSLSAAVRLEKLSSELEKLIKKYRPEALAVENLYFFKNLKTAMPVSQAKGVILLAAAKRGLLIKEFSPPQVKIAVTGYGKAEKRQVQKMVQAILGLEKEPQPDDAADALAIAICYSRHCRP
ncbi:MAG: crossover junction endodeoxyribonuclease RuvC [Candidatus Nealsonbacteria bacterium]|nr:crossover junction endodeoxyribonuclease RuvC [Candidatus Nealsonbacteria bacterium]